jgi:UDP-N-acetyl-D-mannosaminuronic acid dehydrogenase
MYKRNEHPDNEICIMGMGYVGLTLGVAMAKRGYKVHGVEIDRKKLGSLKLKKPYFYEVGLESAMSAMMNNGLLTFSYDIPSRPYPVYIITVGTPLANGTKNPRFDMIERTARQISNIMAEDSLVILRSTVAVGTTREVVLSILQEKVKTPQVVFAPERTLEGRALEELFTLPQVLGAIDERSIVRASQIFYRITPTVVRVSSLETAEIIKLFDNVYRDVQFAIGNEVAEICETVGVNGYEAIQAANLGYARTNIALPGYVGGPCLSKDPYILAYSLNKHNYKPKIMLDARSLHEKLQSRIADRILNWSTEHNLNPQELKVTLLGMAFKGSPQTDDLRAAPSVVMVRELRRRNFKNLFGHDYFVPVEKIAELKIKPVDITEAFNNTSIVIFMNNNPSYKSINLTEATQKMSRPAYFMDSWNMFDREDICLDSSVDYGSIGSC